MYPRPTEGKEASKKKESQLSIQPFRLEITKKSERRENSLIINNSKINNPSFSFGLSSNCQCSSRSTSVTAFTAKIPPDAPTDGTPGNAKFPPSSNPKMAPEKKMRRKKKEPEKMMDGRKGVGRE